MVVSGPKCSGENYEERANGFFFSSKQEAWHSGTTSEWHTTLTVILFIRENVRIKSAYPRASTFIRIEPLDLCALWEKRPWWNEYAYDGSASEYEWNIVAFLYSGNNSLFNQEALNFIIKKFNNFNIFHVFKSVSSVYLNYCVNLTQDEHVGK